MVCNSRKSSIILLKFQIRSKEYMCNLTPVMGNNGHFKGISIQKKLVCMLKDLQIHAIRKNIVTRPQKVRNKAGKRDRDVIQNKTWLFCYDFSLLPAMKELAGDLTKKLEVFECLKNQQTSHYKDIIRMNTCKNITKQSHSFCPINL